MMDDYDILERVGKGSYGTVHLVKRRTSNREREFLYVLKIIEIGDEENGVDYVANEVDVLKSCRHPNVVNFVEQLPGSNMPENGGDAMSVGIVMEYCENGDLANYIRTNRRKKLFCEEVFLVFWVAQLASALSYIHYRHFLHRDIKPGNIFLTHDHHVVKLGDFGITKSLAATLAYASTMVGTPYYFSPELCRNEDYNHKSDIWALGCVIYECMTNSVPFPARDLSTLIQSILYKKPSSPNTKIFSKPLLTILVQMLSKNPDTRPSAKQLTENEFVLQHCKKHESDFLQANVLSYPNTEIEETSPLSYHKNHLAARNEERELVLKGIIQNLQESNSSYFNDECAEMMHDNTSDASASYGSEKAILDGL